MSIKLFLLKKIDILAGTALVHLFAAFQKENKSHKALEKILIIRPGGIGDAVLLISTIKAIRDRYPSAEITVLAERRNGAVFDLCPEVDSVLLYDSPSDLVTALRRRYDIVIDTEQWHRLSAVVARLTNAPLSIGFATNERASLFTSQIAYSHDDYEADSFSNLLEPLEIHPSPVAERFLELPADSAATAAELLAVLDDKPFVTIFPGASIPERRWGADRFRQVADMLSTSGVAVVVVGGGEDRHQGDVIVSGGLGLNLAGRTSLSETAAVIDRSFLLLSGDSGVLHIAVGLGKPTVSLFGPGRAQKWAPRGRLHTVINKRLPCSPCTTYGTTPTCPMKAKCIREIRVEEVFRAVVMQLANSGAM